MKYLENYNFIITAMPEITEMEACSLAAPSHREKQDAVIFTYGTKDVWAMRKKGCTSTEGSLITTHAPAKENLLFTHALTTVGGIFVGTTSLPEFGHKADTHNLVIGQTYNPHNPTLSIGGSSGGSAGAVTSRICHVATATDSAGSIVCPASFSGTVGVKLTNDLKLQPFPNSPEIRFSVNSMSKGFFVRRVEDAAVVLDSLSQHTHNFLSATLSSLDPSAFAGKRIAYLPMFDYVNVDKQVSATVDKALSALPSSLNIEKVDTLGFDDPSSTATTLWFKMHADFYEKLKNQQAAKPNWADLLDPTYLEYVRYGQELPIAKVEQAQRTKAAISVAINKFFTQYDFLIMPAMPTLPWPVGTTRPAHFDKTAAHHVAFSYPFNYSRNPCIVLPCGTTSKDLFPLPVGLQIVGRSVPSQPVQTVKDLLGFSAFCESAFGYDHWPAFGQLRYDYGPSGTCCK